MTAWRAVLSGLVLGLAVLLLLSLPRDHAETDGNAIELATTLSPDDLSAWARREPLSERPYLVASQQTEDMAARTALLDRAVARNGRSQEAASLRFSHAASQGDAVNIFSEIDLLFRINRDTDQREAYVGVLQSLFAVPDIRARIIDTMSETPAWGWMLSSRLRDKVTRFTRPDDPRVAAVRAYNASFEDPETRALLDNRLLTRLILVEAYDTAYELSATRSTDSDAIVNGALDLENAQPPFDWTLIDSDGVTVTDRETGIRITHVGSSERPILRQYVRLRPDTSYALRIDAATERGRTSFLAKVICLNPRSQMALFDVSDGSTTFDAGICRYATVEILPKPLLGSTVSSLRLTSISLRPVTPAPE